MIPWSRSKRKYAKAGEADTVDETNYGAPIEETSFTQVKYFQVFLVTIFKATTTTTTIEYTNEIKRHEKFIKYCTRASVAMVMNGAMTKRA